MSRHIINLPPAPAPPPAPSAPAPRMFAQLMTLAGEMLVVAVLVIGVVTVVGWIVAGLDHRPAVAQRPPSPPLICAIDRRGIEWCRRPEDRLQPRRHLVRD